jgi:hypothetical protein
MKKLLGCILLIIPAWAWAAPFVESDVTTQIVSGCGVQIDTAAKYDTPTLAKACHIDISGVTVGTHSIKATFFNVDPVWGRVESVYSLPLSFTRPVAVMPVAPTGLVITP